jgi:hypothetical protein
VTAPLSRIGRWSPEQRAAAAARRQVVRWLYEEALIDLRTIQGASPAGFNAYLDLKAAGGARRPWLSVPDMRRIYEYRAGTGPGCYIGQRALRVRRLRLRLGLTVEQMAAAFGIEPSTVIGIENGSVRPDDRLISDVDLVRSGLPAAEEQAA